jgi:hypothetical protein
MNRYELLLFLYVATAIMWLGSSSPSSSPSSST